MLFRDLIGIYCEAHTKYINSLCEQIVERIAVLESDIYSYHWPLNN